MSACTTACVLLVYSCVPTEWNRVHRCFLNERKIFPLPDIPMSAPSGPCIRPRCAEDCWIFRDVSTLAENIGEDKIGQWNTSVTSSIRHRRRALAGALHRIALVHFASDDSVGEQWDEGEKVAGVGGRGRVHGQPSESSRCPTAFSIIESIEVGRWEKLDELKGEREGERREQLRGGTKGSRTK